MTTQLCVIDECDRVATRHNREWCNRHYQKWVRHGDPAALPERRMYSTPSESIAARTERQGDCLVWTGVLTGDGYGRISVGGRQASVHRVAWELAFGEIPAGMEVDHVCHSRACVEPGHLRLATHAQNAANRSGGHGLSGARGVHRDHQGWRTRVRKDGRDYGSRHRLLEDAIAEAEALRLELFGEFAGKG